jgi:hypothetical protein
MEPSSQERTESNGCAGGGCRGGEITALESRISIMGAQHGCYTGCVWGDCHGHAPLQQCMILSVVPGHADCTMYIILMYSSLRKAIHACVVQQVRTMLCCSGFQRGRWSIHGSRCSCAGHQAAGCDRREQVRLARAPRGPVPDRPRMCSDGEKSTPGCIWCNLCRQLYLCSLHVGRMPWPHADRPRV